MSRLLLVLLVASLLLTAGCATLFTDRSDHSRLLKGEIDSVRELEVYRESDGDLIMTLVGFTSGKGAVVMGIHPGLRPGKRVRLYLQSQTKIRYKGTTVYRIARIEPESSTIRNEATEIK